MGYSGYASDITSKKEDLTEKESSISKIDFDSLWEGFAHDKQKSNVDALCGEITTQVGYLTSFSSALTSIDEYDAAKEAYDSASNNRSALDSKDEDYSTNYKYYTDIMDEKSKLMKELETKINGLLDGISGSYVTTYTSIPVTEMKSTADILKGLDDVSNTFSSGFDLSNIVVKDDNEYKAENMSYKGSNTPWQGEVLNRRNGVVVGPGGKETYYNLPMQGVVNIMRKMGNNDQYHVREDGVKMLGDYIMVAANLDVHPRGSIVETTLGTAIVCDCYRWAYTHPDYSFDIAVEW